MRGVKCTHKLEMMPSQRLSQTSWEERKFGYSYTFSSTYLLLTTHSYIPKKKQKSNQCCELIWQLSWAESWLQKVVVQHHLTCVAVESCNSLLFLKPKVLWSTHHYLYLHLKHWFQDDVDPWNVTCNDVDIQVGKIRTQSWTLCTTKLHQVADDLLDWSCDTRLGAIDRCPPVSFLTVKGPHNLK